MSFELTEHDHVHHVINNDPATRNSLSPEFIMAFRAYLEELTPQTSPSAIILGGAGGYFCSGGNVSGLKQRSEGDYELRRSNVDRLHGMIRAMRACPCPIIAALEGGAAGAGFAMALACDLIVSSPDAYGSVAYIKIGLTPDGGTTSFLAESMPRWLAMELMLTGDRISMERLHQLGVVNMLVPPDKVLSSAQDVAQKLSHGPRTAAMNGKKLLAQALTSPLDEQLNHEAHHVAEALGHQEGREGISAFLEKRRPNFKGRQS